MVYDSEPPYAILRNDCLDFATVQRVVRLARYWDLLANSGRFSQSLRLLLAGPSAFAAFLQWSDWLWQRSGKTHEFAHEALVDLLYEHLVQVRALAAEPVMQALLADYLASGARGKPRCLAEPLAAREAGRGRSLNAGAVQASRAARQARHASQAQQDTDLQARQA